MVAIALFVLAAAPAAPPAAVLAPAARPVDVIQIVEAPRTYRPFTVTWDVAPADTAAPRSPYRVPASTTVDPTSKDRAFDESGTRCALIGQTICTDPPPVLMTIGEKPLALFPDFVPR
jgi:hypothetical protein